MNCERCPLEDTNDCKHCKGENTNDIKGEDNKEIQTRADSKHATAK